MTRELKELQLNLLGELPLARLTLHVTLEEGVASRDYWVSGEDEDGDQVCMWSARTGAGPAGGLNLPEVMQTLHQILRLTRGLPSTDGSI